MAIVGVGGGAFCTQWIHDTWGIQCSGQCLQCMPTEWQCWQSLFYVGTAASMARKLQWNRCHRLGHELAGVGLQAHGSGAKSVYLPFNWEEAIFLPKSKRAASLQILSFRNLLQNLLTIADEQSFTDFKESKCRSVQRFGHACPVAGALRRPFIPNQQEKNWQSVKISSRSKVQLPYSKGLTLRIYSPRWQFQTYLNQVPKNASINTQGWWRSNERAEWEEHEASPISNPPTHIWVSFIMFHLCAVETH